MGAPTKAGAPTSPPWPHEETRGAKPGAAAAAAKRVANTICWKKNVI